MTQEKLIDAITDLDTDKLNRNFDMKADLAAKKKPKKRTWVKWASLAACFCLVIVGVFHFVIPFLPNQANDPNWAKTHYETTSFDEIVAVCGTQIFNNIPIAEGTDNHYTLEIKEDGDFSNPTDWKVLSIISRYGEYNDQKVSYYISFDGSAVELNPIIFENSTTTEIGGVVVEYREWLKNDKTSNGNVFESDYDYTVGAKFEYNGYTYYVRTKSNDPDFYSTIINQMLADNNLAK